MKAWIVGGMLLAGLTAAAHSADEVKPPTPRREFRGVWVATVDNIDWPSKAGLPVDQQKAELVAIMDRAARLNFNAVVFQVRPGCDALYASSLEPWSEYLTGAMGKAPEPFYDPLAMAVDEAHKRGLELHAWFNPYRARHFMQRSGVSKDHLSQTRPQLVRQYGRYQWLDPSMQEVQDHSLAVMLDVVKRYDIDGVHMDDYFYPYKEKDASGGIIPFPDDAEWRKYQAEGGKLGRDDWRRDGVNRFIERLYKAIKAEKKWVKFGISPFGIWRPGNPPQIQGFDQHQELYADARKWFREGWVDYYTPQLYWRIEQKAQSYPVLLKWWAEQNLTGKHLWPGNYAGRVADGSAGQWVASELPNQIEATRAQTGATGNVHFSMKCLMRNQGGVADALVNGPYADPALAPASRWLDDKAPGRPKVELADVRNSGALDLAWKPTGAEKPWLWVVRTRTGNAWTTRILPAQTLSLPIDLNQRPLLAAVSAVDRCGNESEIATLKLFK